MINVGSGTDVLTFPVWLGLRHINAHVFVRKWIAAQTGEPGAQNGRKIAWDKLQEAARTPNNGDSTNRPLCMQNASRLHPNIAPSDRKEWVNFWKRWVCSRVSRTEKLSALWTWYKCFLLLPRRFSGISRNERSEDRAVCAEGCGWNSKKRVTEGPYEG